MSEHSKELRYYLIAAIATKQAQENGYKTGFENRMKYFEGLGYVQV